MNWQEQVVLGFIYGVVAGLVLLLAIVIGVGWRLLNGLPIIW